MGTYLEIFNVNVHDSSDTEFGYTVAEHLTIVDELKIICLKNHWRPKLEVFICFGCPSKIVKTDDVLS